MGEEQKGFKCVECASVFPQSLDVRRHIRAVHMKIKDHVCHKCGFTTEFMQTLMRHKKTVHKEYSCNMCDSKHVDRRLLMVHMRKVHCDDAPVNETQFLTEEVNIEKGTMKMIRCETTDSVKSETQCLPIKTEKVNTEKGGTRYDGNTIVARSENKKYQCEECPYSSSQRADFQRHVNAVHKNMKDYVCKVCGYATNHKHSLTKHEKHVHLNIKDFACDMCDSRFKDKRNLNAHMKRVHKTIGEIFRDQLYKIGLPGKLILSKRKGLPEDLFS